MEILLIEDDSGDILLTQTAFSELKYKIDLVIKNSVADASLYIEQAEDLPDLVILDLGLPDVSGYDFLKKIKEDEEYKHIPVIILTSSHQLTDLSETLMMGATAFLTKPADFDGFAALAASFINFVPPDKLTIK